MEDSREEGEAEEQESISKAPSAAAREAAEISIARAQLGTLLDRQRREVGIGGQIASSTEGSQETLQDLRVTFGRIDDFRTGLIQPGVQLFERLFD